MDSSTYSKSRIFAIVLIWFSILSIAVFAWKFWMRPQQLKTAEQKAAQDHEETIQKTSAHSRFKYTVNFAADAFSGYAGIRSNSFRDENANFGIKINLVDDGANYIQRLQKLSNGELDMAVFTVDALMKASAEIKDIPATIVALRREI